MDIDFELNKIIIKYGLNVCYPEWTEYYQVLSLMENIFLELPEKATVAVRGGGWHTVELLKFVDTIGMKHKISFIVDHNAGSCKINGINVITPEEAEKINIDVYIISSYRYGLEMEIELWRSTSGNAEIINLYDYFRVNGLAINTEFYNIDLPYITYPDIYCNKKKYRKASDIKEQKIRLQMLIFQCIEIRDFLSAQEYIAEYIQKGFDDGTYKQAWSAIEEFLQNIEERICKRECKDIIINWIDAVEYSGLEEMKFIQEICKQGLVFDNAFTPIPWTHTTMASMFMEKLPIEGKTYLFESKYTSDNSPFLRILEQEGYVFKYIAYPGFYEKDFKKENLIYYEKAYKKTVCGNRSIGCSTRLQWKAIKERLCQSKPVCCLIHNLIETHTPFQSVWLNNNMVTDVVVWDGGVDCTDENILERRTICRKYIDEQLKYYAHFAGENAVSVYMTDHGRSNRAYTDERSRVLMVLHGNIPQVGHEYRMYSHLYFNRVIRYIIKPLQSEYDDIFKNQYVILENIDSYNEGLINKIQKALFETRESVRNVGLPRFFQYRGIRTETELYVHYANGRELFFVLPDENTNLIDDERYQERIAKLKNMCGDNFVDIETEETFKVSTRMYQIAEDTEGIEW